MHLTRLAWPAWDDDPEADLDKGPQLVPLRGTDMVHDQAFHDLSSRPNSVRFDHMTRRLTNRNGENRFFRTDFKNKIKTTGLFMFI